MNQFQQLTAFLIKTMFKEDTPAIPDGKFPVGSEPYIVLTRMRELVAERKINTAENMLFDVFDKKKPYYIRVGLEFYNLISALSDEELEEADFSTEEIGEGIVDMMNFYGVKLAVRKKPDGQNIGNPPAPNVVADPIRKNVGNPPAPNVVADPIKKK